MREYIHPRACLILYRDTRPPFGERRTSASARAIPKKAEVMEKVAVARGFAALAFVFWPLAVSGHNNTAPNNNHIDKRWFINSLESLNMPSRCQRSKFAHH
jgi:hypothetical protein